MKNKPSQLRDSLIANLTPLLIVVFALMTGFLIGQNFEANRKTATITNSTANKAAQAELSEQSSPSIVEEIAASIEGGEGGAPLQLVNQNQNSAVNQSASAPSVSQTTSGKININSATQAQLENLKGIGPTKAKAIIDYRNQNGLFISIDDLLKVKGIGPKTLENIKPYISI